MTSWLQKRLLGFTEIGCLAVALLLLLSFFERQWWVADLFAHWRLHGSAALLAGAAILALLKKGRLTLAAILAAMLPLPALIFPFSHRAPAIQKNPDAPVLKLMSQNVKSQNPRHDEIAAAIEARDPDVLILLELRASWNPLVQDLQTRYPHHLVEIREDDFGLALFSRLPISKSTLEDFSGYDVASIVAELTFYEKPITIIATHPVPPMSDTMWRVRNWAIEDLAERAAEISRPLIVAGDFNTTPWSAAFREFVRTSGLDKANAVAIPTWDPLHTSFLGLPIDHVFVSDQWQVAKSQTGGFNGSDHRAVVAELVLE